MGFKIGLLGLGTVGTGVGEIFANPKGRHPLLQELKIAKVGVRSLEKARSLNLSTEVLTTDLNAIVNDPTIDMVVEVIGGLEPARSLILEAIAQGKHVVTANKAVIARFGEEIFQAATQAGVYVMIEAAVAGGIPVIQPLKESLGANRIHTLIGILNGTTNYILTKMQQSGRPLTMCWRKPKPSGMPKQTPLRMWMAWMQAIRLPFWPPWLLEGGLT